MSRRHYEPGALDVRSGAPQPTPLAAYVRLLAAGASADHPALRTPGRWRRPERLVHAPPARRVVRDDAAAAPVPAPTSPATIGAAASNGPT